VPVHCGVPQYI